MAAELTLRVKVDRSELNALEKQLLKGQTITISANSDGVKKAGEDVDNLGNQAKLATSKVQGLGDMLAKKIAWYAISQSVFGVANAFREALNTMKEVDSQLATIKKVTDFSDEQMSKIKDSAYEVASAYGVAAQAYLESVGTFAKAGYKEAATQLGELATKTQLVGDVNSSIANQFLLSVDAAWKYQGSMEALSKVLDEANEVENNYATSIEKIAVGMPNVASIASMVGMSVEETIAALGTITAVTQQTGSKASTALRALILNITGDINSTFEDSAGELVSWTDEELGVMQKFLMKYAGDVMQKANISGTLVNPIEAIRALGQALENGEVSARDMYDELSSLGGKLRTNQLVALVENYKMLDEMLERMGSSDAIGSADKEIGVMLDTWEAKTNILKNTFADFVENGLNTGSIKNFLDRIINLVESFESLDKLLPSIIAGITAVFAPTILNQMSSWAGALANITGNAGLAGVATKLSSIGSIVGGVAAAAGVALTAYQAYLGHKKQIAQESYEEAKKAYDAETEETNAVLDLYQEYQNAFYAVDNHKGSKEELISVTERLAKALGVEAGAFDEEGKAAEEARKKIEEETKAKYDKTVSEAKLTLKEAYNSLITEAENQPMWSQNPILNAGLGYVGFDENGNEKYFGFGNTQEASQAIIREYNKKLAERAALQNDLINAIGYDEERDIQKQIDKLTDEITEAEPKINKVLDAERELYNLQYEDPSLLTGGGAIAQAGEEAGGAAEGMENFASAEAKAAEEAEIAKKKLEVFSEAFDRITSSSDEATAAIQRYKDATSVQATDNAGAMANAYVDFYKQVEAGNYGAAEVGAGIDLLLGSDIINKYQGNTKKLAKVLADDFFKQIFITGVDENGEYIAASGEEVAGRFVNVFRDQIATGTDKAGNSVLKVGKKIVATLKETEDGWKLNVKDIEALSKAMGGIDTDALEAFLDAMGFKTGETLRLTTEEIYELAYAADAVHKSASGLKQVNLAKIINDAFAAGKSDTEVWNLVNALKEADENGDIDLVINWDTVQEADDRTVELIDNLDKAGIPVVAYVDSSSIDTANKSARELRDALKDKITGTVEVQSNLQQQLELAQRLKNATGGYSERKAIEADRLASGTQNAQGGPTLVNEEGAEIIQEGDTARIAGGGRPTITFIQSGAKVWNAKETEAILGNKDASVLFDGIGALAGGTNVPSSIANVTHNANRKTVVLGSTDANKTLEWYRNYVSLRKAEYDLAEARNVKTIDLVKKEQQIQSALKEEIEYLKKIKGSQEEIDQLTTEYYQINQKIAELQKGLLDNLQTAIGAKIDQINEKRDKELDKIDAKIAKLKEAKEIEDEAARLQEKELAVNEALEKLQNSRNNRNIRIYNASTGQWENVANAAEVSSAQKGLEDAQKALSEYQKQQKYQNDLAALEAKKESITEKFLTRTNAWQAILDSLKEPVQSIGSALKAISKNATRDQASTIKALNKLLKPLGYSIDTSNLYDSGGVLSGIGGIKATASDEVILPPDITKKMLKPTNNAGFANRLNELRYLYGVTGNISGAISNDTIGNQYNGNMYNFGSITLTEDQARGTSVYEFVKMSRGLRAYNAM